MKTIELTQGKVALVDDENFEKLNQYKWCVFKPGTVFYAVRNTRGVNPRRLIYMHRIITNAPESMAVDHINGNGLDNCKSNLRVVTRRQNNQNKHIEKSSIFPGVSWNKRDENWKAQIKINGKSKYLGCFKIESEAHEAYLKALEKLGETYVTNIIKEEYKWCI